MSAALLLLKPLIYLQGEYYISAQAVGGGGCPPAVCGGGDERRWRRRWSVEVEAVEEVSGGGG